MNPIYKNKPHNTNRINKIRKRIKAMLYSWKKWTIKWKSKIIKKNKKSQSYSKNNSSPKNKEDRPSKKN